MILIRDATTLTDTGVRRVDVLVEGPTVSAVGHLGTPKSARVIEGTDLILGPALVDIHVHLREPGEEHKEDIETGSHAAAKGGFAAIVAMPNTLPACDTVEAAANVLERGHSVGLAAVIPSSAVTMGRLGSELVDMKQLHQFGVRVFTDDGDPVVSPKIMRSALAATADLDGAVVAQHAENRIDGPLGHLHQGEVAKRLGVTGIPPTAETDLIERDLVLADETGGRLHIQHLSTARGVELVAGAKGEGLDVTAEVTPHHLFLTEEAAGDGDPDFKMYPPLREETDRKALQEGLRSGVIDIVASDHAPHSPAEKETGIEAAPRGVIGLETSLAVTGTILDWDVAQLFDRMSIAPAARVGLERHGAPIAPGSPANLVLIDPTRKWVAGHFRSRAMNSPFKGMELTGRAVMTVYEGSITWEELG